MNRHFTRIALLSICLPLLLRVGKSYGCDQRPVAVIYPLWSQYACVDGSISYYGGYSYDPDGGYIELYQWWLYDGYDWQWAEGPYLYSWDPVFETLGQNRVELYVRDDEGDWSWKDYVYVSVFDFHIENNPPDRDTAEYISYQSGMNIYYKIEPTSGWKAETSEVRWRKSASD